MNFTIKKKKHDYGIERTVELTDVVGDKITVYTDATDIFTSETKEYKCAVVSSRFGEWEPRAEFDFRHYWDEPPTDEELAQKAEEFHKKAIKIAATVLE